VQSDSVLSSVSFGVVFFGLPVVGMFLIVFDYYVEFLARAKLSTSVLTKSAVGTQFVFALILEWIWPIVAGLDFSTIISFIFILVGT